MLAFVSNFQTMFQDLINIERIAIKYILNGSRVTLLIIKERLGVSPNCRIGSEKK